MAKAIAMTDQQGARMWALSTGVSELVRDGKRDPEEWLAVLQAVKNEEDGARKLLGNLRQKTASAADRLGNIPVWRTLTIGGYSREELPKIAEKEKFQVSPWAQDMMTRPEFVTSSRPYTIRLGRIRVGDLGFTAMPYTPEFFEKLGQYFDECPPETGLHLHQIYRDQPMDEWLAVYQKPITGSGGVLGVFGLDAHSVGLWLCTAGARPEDRWGLERGFVVRLRE